MLPAKALFALAAAAIAGTFVAVLLTSRGPTDGALADRDRLEQFGEEQERVANGRGCEDAVGHAVAAAADFLVSRYGDGAPDAVRALTLHRCTSDGWSGEVVRCLGRVSSDNEMQRCVGQLPEYQRRALEAEMRAFAARPPMVPSDAAVDADPMTDLEADDLVDPLQLAPTDTTWPPACVEYELLIGKLGSCDKLPQASRDALKQGFDAMKSGWSDRWGTGPNTMSAMPAASRTALESGCREAVDALQQAGASICGW